MSVFQKLKMKVKAINRHQDFNTFLSKKTVLNFDAKPKSIASLSKKKKWVSKRLFVCGTMEKYLKCSLVGFYIVNLKIILHTRYKAHNT